jgi:hypothetical protein
MNKKRTLLAILSLNLLVIAPSAHAAEPNAPASYLPTPDENWLQKSSSPAETHYACMSCLPDLVSVTFSAQPRAKDPRFQQRKAFIETFEKNGSKDTALGLSQRELLPLPTKAYALNVEDYGIRNIGGIPAYSYRYSYQIAEAYKSKIPAPMQRGGAQSYLTVFAGRPLSIMAIYTPKLSATNQKTLDAFISKIQFPADKE